MPIRIRRQQSGGVVRRRQVLELQPGDALLYKGLEIDASLLDTVLTADARLLWAFIKGKDGSVIVIPYDESQCIWMSDKDILQPEDVEL